MSSFAMLAPIPDIADAIENTVRSNLGLGPADAAPFEPAEHAQAETAEA